jgi:hypothetical protein
LAGGVAFLIAVTPYQHVECLLPSDAQRMRGQDDQADALAADANDFQGVNLRGACGSRLPPGGGGIDVFVEHRAIGVEHRQRAEARTQQPIAEIARGFDETFSGLVTGRTKGKKGGFAVR